MTTKFLRTVLILTISSVLGLGLAACAPSESKWKTARKENSLAGYAAYIAEFPTSPHCYEARTLMEEVEWTTTLAAKDAFKIRSLMEKYPNSTNCERAIDELWKLEGKNAHIEEVVNVIIYDGDELKCFIGAFSLSADGNPTLDKTESVIIWRSLGIQTKDKYLKLGLRAGIAYRRSKEGNFKFIRKVEMSLSDEQLAEEFRPFVKERFREWGMPRGKGR